MPKFSQKSKDKLATCHPDLQRVFNEVIKHVDCTIIEGKRSLETQQEYVRSGKSKTMNSKHLEQDDGYSWAVDCIAYPIDWNNWQRNYLFAGYVKGVARSMGVDLRIGADWNGNFDTSDQSFHDLPHFELRSAAKKSSATQGKKEYLPDGPSDTDIDISLEEIEDSIFSED